MTPLVSPYILEDSQRAAVVKIAKSWLGTPYHHMGRIKGAGVDCLTILAETFHEAKLIPKIEVSYYPKDWMLHRDAERYLEGLLKYANEIPGSPKPGDIVLWKIGRCFSHGAIVVEWPIVIHANAGRNVSLDNIDTVQALKFEKDGKTLRPTKFFSYWGK